MKLEKTIYLPDGDIRIITLKKIDIPPLKRNDRKAKTFCIRDEKFNNDGSVSKEYPIVYKPDHYIPTSMYTKFDVIDASKSEQQFILDEALSKSDVGIVLYILYRNSQSPNFEKMLVYVINKTSKCNKLSTIVNEVYHLRKYYAARFLLRKRYVDWTGDKI